MVVAVDANTAGGNETPISEGQSQPDIESLKERELEKDSAKTVTEAIRFDSAGQGTTELVEAFNDWSSILTNRGIELAYALIAANWAVHGTTSSILSSICAKLSMAIALGFLGLNLIGTYIMARLHSKQIAVAEVDHQGWTAEFKRTAGTSEPWPYTYGIQKLGRILRGLKISMPIAGAGFFLLSLFP